MADKNLQVIVFPGGFNLPIWSGMAQGYFTDFGIELDLHLTTSSKEQLAGLINGDWDIGMTGVDNVIAYQEGQGEVQLDREPDLFTFMGGDDAFLSLVTGANIQTFSDLKGKTLSVDAMTTGFAFVLRKMVENGGIKENEISYLGVGGVLQRWESLKAGEQDGTLLLTPFDVIGESIGLNVLARARDIFPAYQGIIGAARRSWAAENGELLTSYIRAYRKSLNWLFDPENREAAEQLLVDKVPSMAPHIASAACDIFLHPQTGFDRDAKIDWEGIRTVLKLRSEYGRPQKILDDPEKYVDLSWYQVASSE